MRKLSLILSIILCFALCSCGNAPASDTAIKDYAAIIDAARTEEEIQGFELVTDKQSELGGSVLDMLAIEPEAIDSFAAACSFMNVNAYCVAIFKATDSKAADNIKAALEEYVNMQKKSMENYLPDQYELASNAIIKKAKSGEIIIVMCQGANTVAAELEKALK